MIAVLLQDTTTPRIPIFPFIPSPSTALQALGINLILSDQVEEPVRAQPRTKGRKSLGSARPSPSTSLGTNGSGAGIFAARSMVTANASATADRAKLAKLLGIDEKDLRDVDTKDITS
jgi:hypothetical protein